MPTPKKGYFLKDGTRVPGYSGIVGKFRDPNPLMWWANRLALNPLLQARALASNPATAIDCATFLMNADPDTWDHKLAAARAADAGTAAHDMVDCWIHSRPFDPKPYGDGIVEMAQPAFEGFKKWRDQSRLVVGETEVQLVSERYRFGGTRDATTVDGKRAIIDWKTSKAVFAEHLLQLAAYGILDEEAGNKIDGGYHLLRISKQAEPGDPVSFHHHHWDQLDVAREAFILMRSLYDLMGRLEKMV